MKVIQNLAILKFTSVKVLHTCYTAQTSTGMKFNWPHEKYFCYLSCKSLKDFSIIGKTYTLPSLPGGVIFLLLFPSPSTNLKYWTICGDQKRLPSLAICISVYSLNNLRGHLKEGTFTKSFKVCHFYKLCIEDSILQNI